MRKTSILAMNVFRRVTVFRVVLILLLAFLWQYEHRTGQGPYITRSEDHGLPSVRIDRYMLHQLGNSAMLINFSDMVRINKCMGDLDQIDVEFDRIRCAIVYSENTIYCMVFVPTDTLHTSVYYRELEKFHENVQKRVVMECRKHYVPGVFFSTNPALSVDKYHTACQYDWSFFRRMYSCVIFYAIDVVQYYT